MPTTVPPALVNATGRILDPNLGGTPWSAAARAAATAAAGYADLGRDPLGTTGAQAAALLGAGDAMVASSLPGAIALVLAALPWQPVIARPDMISVRGARLGDLATAVGRPLVEVGAADVVEPDDYRRVLTPSTAVIVVHPVAGAARPTWSEVVAIADASESAHVHLVLSGALHESALGARTMAASTAAVAEREDADDLRSEPSAAEVLDAGANLVVVATDGLAGGPALALLAGSPSVLDVLRAHPLAAALRADRTLVAALAATLDAHDAASPPTSLPVHAMLTTSTASLEARARSLAAAVGHGAEAIACRSATALAPRDVIHLDSWGLLVPSGDPDALADRLAGGVPPIVGVLDEAGVVLDLRTVAPSHDPLVARAVQSSLTVPTLGATGSAFQPPLG